MFYEIWVQLPLERSSADLVLHWLRRSYDDSILHIQPYSPRKPQNIRTNAVSPCHTTLFLQTRWWFVLLGSQNKCQNMLSLHRLSFSDFIFHGQTSFLRNLADGVERIPRIRGTLIKGLVPHAIASRTSRARRQITGIKKSGRKKAPHGANHVGLNR